MSPFPGSDFKGNVLKAEMSVGSEKKSGSSTTYKVVLTNLPDETKKDDLDSLIKDVQAIDISSPTEGEASTTVTLTYHSKEEAEKYTNLYLYASSAT